MFSGKTDDRGLWAGIQAGVLFFLAALACIYLSRQPATIAAIWLPNAILTAALLRAPLRQWPAILLCSAVANLAANRLYGDSLWMSAAFLPANLSEAIFAAMLLRINRVREDFEFNLHSAVRVLWAGALIPPLLGGIEAGRAALRAEHQVAGGVGERGAEDQTGCQPGPKGKDLTHANLIFSFSKGIV